MKIQPRSIDQRKNSDGFPKAGELIAMKPSQELSLQDARIFNALIENAGPEIYTDRWHEIPIQILRGPKHKGGERVRDSIKRLMTTLVEMPVKDRNGLPAIQTTALLSENIATIDENDPRAILRYKLTETMRSIVESSKYWGRLKGYVIYAFSSRYALALYEAICLRINLEQDRQTLSVDQFRDLMRVGKGKYPLYSPLRQFVIEPALIEVNGLSDFMVTIEPVREGGILRGKLKGFELSWRKKEPDEWKSVLDELGRHHSGRRARLFGLVESIK